MTGASPKPLIILAALLTSVGPPAADSIAADPFDEIRQRFEQRQREGDLSLADVESRFHGLREGMEADWQRMEREVQAKWEHDKREIERRWGEALRSTKKEWVDYDSRFETRSIVNFEEGTVEVTTLVPVPKVAPPPGPGPRPTPGPAPAEVPPEARERITQQFGRLLTQEVGPGQGVLDGQVVDGAGRPVTKPGAEAFVKQEVLPSLEVDRKPVVSPDGVERMKVTAKVRLTPDHLKRRARQYLDLVLRESRRQRLDPRLVLAVIQTESYFNPMAQSPAPAYGLMQLVPRAAARDAYNLVYGTDRVLDPGYLTDPAHNVELGVAYLRLLMSNLFADVPSGEKQLYVVVCAYNWGPGNIRNKILKRVRLQDLSEQQVFALLTDRTPEETRQYLKRVTERRSLYEELVSR